MTYSDFLTRKDDAADVIMKAPWGPVNMTDICKAACKRYRQDFSDMKNRIRYLNLMLEGAMKLADYPKVRGYNAEIMECYRQIHSLREDYKFMWHKAVGN